MVKRAPPPTVAPVVVDGTRFEAITNGKDRDLDQNGGYIFARDNSTDALLWQVKVYDQPVDPNGMNVDIFISAMKKKLLRPQLAITNEQGEKFTLNLETRMIS